MPVSPCTFFDSFGEDLANGVHNLGTDTVKIYFSNSAPTASTDQEKSEVAEIANSNNEGNHGTGGADTQNTVFRPGASTEVRAVDANFEATTGTVGDFRYVVAYNENTGSDDGSRRLICYWDHGGPVNLGIGDQYDVDFGSDKIMTITFT